MPRWANTSLAAVCIPRLPDLARLRLVYLHMPTQASNWYRCVSKIEILTFSSSRRCRIVLQVPICEALNFYCHGDHITPVKEF